MLRKTLRPCVASGANSGGCRNWIWRWKPILSYLETGRSRPSREMVLRLTEAMDIPLRERNSFLQSAGYSAAYSETNLDEPTMAPVMEALDNILRRHDPLPAVVVDRFWNVKMQNKAAGLLLSVGGDPEEMLEKIGAKGEFNLALLTVHPQGLRQYIANWDQAAPAFIRRLKREAMASGTRESRNVLKNISNSPDP